MRNVFVAVVTAFCLTSILPASAQDLIKTSWSAYGVSFKVPADISIEDDSEEGYVLSNNDYYIQVQILDGETMDKRTMVHEIKQLANEDQLKEQSLVKEFDLAQFLGVQLSGSLEGEYYLYNYLTSKDESCGFFVTVIYKDLTDRLPTDIIRSFELQE